MAQVAPNSGPSTGRGIVCNTNIILSRIGGENSCKCSRLLHYNSIYKYVETELRLDNAIRNPTGESLYSS